MAYDRAVALLRAGKTTDALTALRDFRTKFPTHALTPDVLHILAGTEHQAGDYAASAEHCAEFLQEYRSHNLAAAVSFLAAENAFLSKDYPQATEQYRAFLTAFPGDPQADKARLRLGLALHRSNDLDAAVEQLQQVESFAAKQPLFLPALLTLGDIYFTRSEWKRAEDYYQAYVKQAGDADGIDDVVFKAAYAQQRQGKNEQAIKAYERVVKDFPESPHRLQALFETGQILVTANRPQEAAAVFERVLSEGGDDSRFASFALNHLAAIAGQKGDSQAAAGFYARAAKSADGGASASVAQLRQAQSLIGANAFKEAEDVLRRLLASDAKFAQAAEAKAQLAIALSRMDRHEEALAIIADVQRQSETIPPELRASLQYEKAWAERKLGREDAALQSYDALLALDASDDLSIHALLESAELAMKAKQFAQAEDALKRLTARLAKAPKADYTAVREQCAYQSGACAFELGRHKEAADLFGAFVTQFPESELLASALYFAGESYFQAGRHEKAIDSFARVAAAGASEEVLGPSMLRLGESNAALQRWPASEKAFADYLSRFPDAEVAYQARFGIGWARENQKQYDDAIREYEKVVANHNGPTAARSQFQIGECLFAKGAFEEAIREFLKVDILYAYPQWSAAATFEAGRCFEKLGKTAEAKAHFQMVLDKYKDTEWSKSASQHLAQTASSAGVPGR
jgi:TolA-binding protein